MVPGGVATAADGTMSLVVGESGGDVLRVRSVVAACDGKDDTKTPPPPPSTAVCCSCGTLMVVAVGELLSSTAAAEETQEEFMAMREC